MRRYVRDSYGEVLEILRYMDKKYTKKLPKELIEYLKANVHKEYKSHLNPKYPIYDQELEQNTMVILAMLNLNYWANDKEKIRLKRQFIMNESNDK